MSLLNDAQFLTSAPSLKACPPPDVAEVAFAGRSNAGKSSVLNCVTGKKQLARVSRTPGRTRALNFFAASAGRLVDLPGYGYAKVDKQTLASWGQHIDAYLARRKSLRGVVLVTDARHEMKPFDRQMIEWSEASDTPLHVLLNKADKLNQSGRAQALKRARAVAKEHENVTVQLFSALNRTGVEELLAQVHAWLAMDPSRDD